MLRKKTREFLMYWPQKESKDPEIQKIRKEYETRNPSQIYNRAVKYANGVFEDLHYLFQYLPENYLNKVDIEKGVRYLHLEENQQSQYSNIRLRIALSQATAGLRTLREVLREDELLRNLYVPKLFEMDFIANLLYEIGTGKMSMDKKSKEVRNRKLTKLFNEYKKGIM